MSAREKRLFRTRFLILLLFAAAGISLGVICSEISHLTFAVIGMRILDTLGEALAEAME
jgi:hypothetical protein